MIHRPKKPKNLQPRDPVPPPPFFFFDEIIPPTNFSVGESGTGLGKPLLRDPLLGRAIATESGEPYLASHRRRALRTPSSRGAWRQHRHSHSTVTVTAVTAQSQHSHSGHWHPGAPGDVIVMRACWMRTQHTAHSTEHTRTQHTWTQHSHSTVTSHGHVTHAPISKRHGTANSCVGVSE